MADLTTHRLRELHRAALDRQMAANDAVAQREGTDTAAAIDELLRMRAKPAPDVGSLAEQAGAWEAVYCLLCELRPELMEPSGTGQGLALACIRSLACAAEDAERLDWLDRQKLELICPKAWGPAPDATLPLRQWVDAARAREQEARSDG